MEKVNKNYFVSLNLLLVITFIIGWSSAAEFSYKDEPYWPLQYPQCGGQSQSPVNLEDLDYDGKDPDIFSLINYKNKPSSVNLMNMGNTIMLNFEWADTEPPYMARGVFKDNEYVFDSMHFHWSRVSRQGSEHILFGFQGIMEMHLVHYNRKYGNKTNARNYDDGLILLGALFNTNGQRRRRDSGDNDDDYDYDNAVLAASQKSPAVSEILSNVGSVKTPGSSVDIEPFAIDDVRPVPLDKSRYVSYVGSISSPPCTENVVRMTSLYPYQITEEQLQYLQETVEFDHGDDHNNRPVQQMNGRKFSVLWGVPETSD